jgi:hypothetical protein
MTLENVNPNENQTVDKDKEILNKLVATETIPKKLCATEVIKRLRGKIISDALGLSASIMLFAFPNVIFEVISVLLITYFIVQIVLTSRDMNNLKQKYGIK